MKPGEDLIEQGIEDLQDGVESIASLQVSIGANRLRQSWDSGPLPNVPDPRRSPISSIEKYDNEAHSKYNSYNRRLVSFERAAECGI